MAAFSGVDDLPRGEEEVRQGVIYRLRMKRCEWGSGREDVCLAYTGWDVGGVVWDRLLEDFAADVTLIVRPWGWV